MSSATKVPILGKESIIVDYGLWQNFVVQDLLANIPSSTYVLICDTNIAKLGYVPAFKAQFEKERNIAAHENVGRPSPAPQISITAFGAPRLCTAVASI